MQDEVNRSRDPLNVQLEAPDCLSDRQRNWLELDIVQTVKARLDAMLNVSSMEQAMPTVDQDVRSLQWTLDMRSTGTAGGATYVDATIPGPSAPGALSGYTRSSPGGVHSALQTSDPMSFHNELPPGPAHSITGVPSNQAFQFDVWDIDLNTAPLYGKDITTRYRDETPDAPRTILGFRYFPILLATIYFDGHSWHRSRPVWASVSPEAFARIPPPKSSSLWSNIAEALKLAQTENNKRLREESRGWEEMSDRHLQSMDSRVTTMITRVAEDFVKTPQMAEGIYV
jgi:hypothetical protein